MATLRALETVQPLQRFVELTKLIRTLETERDGLKDQITEALQHEPPSGPSGEQFVDFDSPLASTAHEPFENLVGRIKIAFFHKVVEAC